MKTPWYETSPGALQALLSSRAFVFANLYTFAPVGGVPVYYSTADIDIPVQDTTWVHTGPYFDIKGASGANGHWKIGLDVDTWSIQLLPRLVDPVTGAATPDELGGVPWLQAVKNGALDNAVVTVDRVYLSQWPQAGQLAVVTGAITIFKGLVADVSFGRSSVAVALKSYLSLLSGSMPPHVYQASCRHTLFDTGCTLLASSFSRTGTVSSAASQGVFSSAVAAPPGSGTYALGRVTFTSGANAGQVRGVRSWAGGVFTLITPLPSPIAPGDAFTAVAGCDKTLATCTAFSNTINFGGQPYIPDALTAV